MAFIECSALLRSSLMERSARRGPPARAGLGNRVSRAAPGCPGGLKCDLRRGDERPYSGSSSNTSAVRPAPPE